MPTSIGFDFCKMHGLGNDFVIIDGIKQPIQLNKKIIQSLADRHLGIGFDQLLIIESSSKTDFACRIFNADGSETEQCGNGVRCVARYIHEEQLSHKKTMTLATLAGILKITIDSYEKITVDMGQPIFASQDIPFLVEHSHSVFEVADISPNQFSTLSMGNPHAIVQVPSVKNYPVKTVGEKFSAHPAFPAGVNTGFVEVVDRQHIRLRTFERGSGETVACGSNACAAVVAGIKNQLLDSPVTVELAYGNLIIEWQGENQPVLMTGPAARVFTGTVSL